MKIEYYVIRRCHQNSKVSCTEWLLDQPCCIVLASQALSHLVDESYGDKDVTMDV